MLSPRIAILSAALCVSSAAAVRSGKSTAEWISATTNYEAGKPVQTAVRLVLDPGWHTYWLNPGEAGMKISATWELPAGWTAGELEHPVPKRFMTGELAGFGYEGSVVFPVKFTPPAGFKGWAKLKGKISWLTCNDDSCVPGDVELELALADGAPAATAEAKSIQDALTKVPRPNPEISLTVAAKPESLVLSLQSPSNRPLELTGHEIFPATSQVIDPAAKIEFARHGDQWTAEVPKSEFAPKAIQTLTLVLAGKDQQAPMTLSWTADPVKSQ
jgi:DsbC/DsbD-like thiol-disulfide interchange protein